MSAFKDISDVSVRTETDVSQQELLGIMECETYTEDFVDRSFKSLGKEKVSAKDILDAKAVDVDSRLHAFFALNFLTEKTAIITALKFTEQMFYLLEHQPELLQEAENAIIQLRHALDGDESGDLGKLEITLRELYDKHHQTKEALVFEALLKIFQIQAQRVPESVAGSARAAAAWIQDPDKELVEKKRLAIATAQLDYLRSLY